MKYLNKKIVITSLIFVASILLVGKFYLKDYEMVGYQTLFSEKNFQIRNYPKSTHVSTLIDISNPNHREVAFKRLFDYISGNNKEESKIDMTIPVLQIIKNNKLKMSFVVPKKYELSNMPTPNNPNIFFDYMTEGKYLVITFNGSPDQQNITNQIELLKKYALENNFTLNTQKILAVYDPPWTIPFLKRNEILSQIS